VEKGLFLLAGVVTDLAARSAVAETISLPDHAAVTPSRSGDAVT
jgi:hypothetical protein